MKVFNTNQIKNILFWVPSNLQHVDQNHRVGDVAVQLLLLGHVRKIDESPGYNAWAAIEEKLEVEPLADARVELDAHHVIVEDVPCELAGESQGGGGVTVEKLMNLHSTADRAGIGFVSLHPLHSPVLCGRGEKVGLYKGKGGHGVAQNVTAPHQRDPVVEDDGGRKPVEIVSVGKPQGMSDQPTLQPIDLVLVNQA